MSSIRPYTTLAGLLLEHLGRIPEASGDEIRLDGWSLEVTEVAGHRVTGVRAIVDRPAAEPLRPSEQEASVDES